MLKSPWDFVDLDRELEDIAKEDKGQYYTCRQIYQQFGADEFSRYEAQALKSVAARKNIVLSPDNQSILKSIGKIIYLKADPEVIFHRMESKGLPAWLQKNPTLDYLKEVWNERNATYETIADEVVANSHMNIDDTAYEIFAMIKWS